jgi:hypothetical protein
MTYITGHIIVSTARRDLFGLLRIGTQLQVKSVQVQRLFSLYLNMYVDAIFLMAVLSTPQLSLSPLFKLHCPAPLAELPQP